MTVGRWLKANGEAVYGRGVSPFGEGFPTYGRTARDDAARVPHIPFTNWRCTTAPGRLYFTVFHWSSTGLKLPRFGNEVTKAYLLSDPGQALTVAGENGERIVQLPKYAPDVMATVVVVEIRGDHAMIAAEAR